MFSINQNQKVQIYQKHKTAEQHSNSSEKKLRNEPQMKSNCSKGATTQRGINMKHQSHSDDHSRGGAPSIAVALTSRQPLTRSTTDTDTEHH